MPILVVDACALVHLKQAHYPHTDGLDLVTLMCRSGLRLVSTRKVHQENEQQTLREWLEEKLAADLYSFESVSIGERRAIRNNLLNKMKEPGDNDKALIALAKRLEVPLFTHDGPAGALAARSGVIVVDAIDLAAFASRLGLMSQAQAEHMVGPLGRHAWSPPSWAGTIQATIAGRPRWDRLENRLQAWWTT